MVVAEVRPAEDARAVIGGQRLISGVHTGKAALDRLVVTERPRTSHPRAPLNNIRGSNPGGKLPAVIAPQKIVILIRLVDLVGIVDFKSP